MVYKVILPLVLGVFLSGCSDDKSKKSSAPIKSSDSSGSFIDIEGINYKTSSDISGTTGSAGEYDYNAGDTVAFYLGDIKLGEAKAEALLTPLHFLNDKTVDTDTVRATEITRLLIAIDNDEFAGNGIQVSKEAHKVAMNVRSDYSDIDQTINVDQANSMVTAISEFKPADKPNITRYDDVSQATASAYLESQFISSGPLVVHTSPTYRDSADQAVLPSIESIDVRFSNSVVAHSVNNKTFTVTDAAGNDVEGRITLSGGNAGKTASFDPTSALAPATTYKVTLTSDIKDSTDVLMPQEYSFSFTTIAAQGTAVSCINSAGLQQLISTSGNSTVNVVISVIDCSGNAVKGLTNSDILVFDGVEKNKIPSDDYETYLGYPVASFTNTQIDTVILIDNSTSVSDREFISYIKTAKDLITAGSSKKSNLIEGQRVAIYTFDNSDTTISGYSQDTLKLWNDLDALQATRPASTESTNFYGSIDSMATILGASTDTTTKSLVILSDAIDTSSTSTFDQAFNGIKTNDIQSYLISNNPNINTQDAAGFNQVADEAKVKAALMLEKADNVNFIDSLYTTQFSSPKRASRGIDLSFEIVGNNNLTEDDLKKTDAYNSSGFIAEVSNLKLIDGKVALVVAAGETLNIQAVSEFAPSSDNYSWSSDNTNIITTSTNTDKSTTNLTYVGAGVATVTINDNTNNLTSTIKVYAGSKYEWDFESKSLDGWSAGLGWGITTVSADDRRNTSDFALGMPDSADPDGLYASSVSSEILSPEMDLTRFAGGAPVLDFKYLLRNASAADNVVVELVDSSVSPSTLVATLSTIDMFTHDWTEHSPISLNAHTGLQKANLRFRFTSDAADEYEGFKLDSVKVRPTQ